MSIWVSDIGQNYEQHNEMYIHVLHNIPCAGGKSAESKPAVMPSTQALPNKLSIRCWLLSSGSESADPPPVAFTLLLSVAAEFFAAVFNAAHFFLISASFLLMPDTPETSSAKSAHPFAFPAAVTTPENFPHNICLTHTYMHTLSIGAQSREGHEGKSPALQFCQHEN